MKGDALKGILAIWHDMVAERETDINNWYNHQHHNERANIEGFHSAYRHVALEGAPKYFTYYETDTPAVLDSDAYLTRVNNPTDWTQRVMPNYRNTNRLVCTRDLLLGYGHGAAVMTIRCKADGFGQGEKGDALRALAEAAIHEDGVVSLHLWRLDAERTHVPTKEKEMRGKQDAVADGVIVLTANLADQARTACDKHFNTRDLLERGLIEGAPDAGLYQLIFTRAG